VAKKLRHIKRVFKLAVNRKQLDENPLQCIAMPKSPKKKINIYTDSAGEFRKLPGNMPANGIPKDQSSGIC